MAGAQSFLLRNPTSQKLLTETAAAAAAGRHIKGPVGGLKDHSVLSYFLSPQKWAVWIQAGVCWLEMRVWVLSGHTCIFPACHKEFLFSP